uniref:alpha/beta hydrolase n=1 Tax=uncultured Christiangramia sp. TaxID=503836 RepID=UPI0026117D30|nr:alpha/beta hydrolase [uncultured Christiangramia sp.]
MADQMNCFKEILLCFLIFFSVNAIGQEINYTEAQNLNYYEAEDQTAYQQEMCKLDIHHPDEGKAPVVIWFHGGGLTSGSKEIPEALKQKGFCIVGVGYRLSPDVQAEVSVEDAAASIAWVLKNIQKYNGDPDEVYISGHSAGGYLALMSVMNKSFLDKYNLDANDIAGLIPFSGHTITHFTIRKQNNIPNEQPIIDKWAPLFYVRNDAPPTLLITGDREMEMLGRYEENAFFYRMMKVAGHKEIDIYEMQGYGHNMAHPAFPLLLNFVRKHSEKIGEN